MNGREGEGMKKGRTEGGRWNKGRMRERKGVMEYSEEWGKKRKMGGGAVGDISLRCRRSRETVSCAERKRAGIYAVGKLVRKSLFRGIVFSYSDLSTGS